MSGARNCATPTRGRPAHAGLYGGVRRPSLHRKDRLQPPAHPDWTTMIELNREAVNDLELWLLSAARDARVARFEWALYGGALLRCGRVFTTIHVRSAIISAAAGTASPEEIRAYLASAVNGPVYFDSEFGRYTALVPVGAGQTWSDPNVSAARPSALALVPPPSRTAPDGPVHWVVPLGRPGVLCAPEDVADVAAAGCACLRLGEASDER